MKMLLETQCDKYLWTVCWDLKEIFLLISMQLGCTKFAASCMSGTGQTITSAWTLKCCTACSFISNEILLPPLHIKVDIFTNLEWRRVPILERNISSFSDAEIMKGTFLSPQITALFSVGNFEDLLSPVEKSAWRVLKGVTQHFL
ncbi:hypothetical protein PR048_020069 [Dryococelus australis]|uniref:Uncharacterized protein n=1 Tax=Dryococelus australis TaxID=614101 RepID=A0ABQ9H5A5_9NEOP|nr:hypothetical protein PR048_020069 [Dryococelus australis]